MGRTAYRVVRPNGTVTGERDLHAAIEVVRLVARKLGPRWRVRLRGHEPGRWREPFHEAVDHLHARLKDADEREVWILEGEGRPGVVRVRVLESDPPPIQTQGNAKIDVIYSHVVRSFPGRVRSAGICVRRPIDGTSTWSQHSPWPAPDPGANAWDWFAPSFDELEEQGWQVAAAAARGEIPLGLLLVGDRAWDPDRRWHDSGAAFHHHAHAEGRPRRTGPPSPAC